MTIKRVSARIPDRTLSGSNIIVGTTNPPVQTAQYVEFDVVGGKQTLRDAAREEGSSGFLVWMHAFSVSSVGVGVKMSVIIFEEDPVNSTFNENEPPQIAAADIPKIAGVVDLNQRFGLSSDNTFLQESKAFRMPFQCADGSRDVYAVAIATGNITFAAETDLYFRFGGEQD